MPEAPTTPRGVAAFGRTTPRKDPSTRRESNTNSAFTTHVRKTIGGATAPRAHSIKLKDPRPVGDRAFMQHSVRAIAQLLASTSYPHSLSPKFVQGPSGKEYYNLMQYLFSLVDAHTPLSRKMEEELPDALARVKYPLSITKASLLLVATLQPVVKKSWSKHTAITMGTSRMMAT